jgi:hypothetical protein
MELRKLHGFWKFLALSSPFLTFRVYVKIASLPTVVFEDEHPVFFVSEHIEYTTSFVAFAYLANRFERFLHIPDNFALAPVNGILPGLVAFGIMRAKYDGGTRLDGKLLDLIAERSDIAGLFSSRLPSPL